MSKTRYSVFSGYKFKLIPFIISLLIIISITIGTMHYTMFLNENLKEDYLFNQLEDLNLSTSLVPDKERIEKYIHFNSNYYEQITDEVKYYDARKAKVSSVQEAMIGETPTKTGASFTFEGSTYKNGVLHLGDGEDHMFDMMVYLESTNVNKANVINYYFILFNINYKKINPDKLSFVYCNNYQLVPNHEYVIGDEKLNMILNEYRNHYFDNKNGFFPNGATEITTTAFEKTFMLNDIHGSNQNNPIESLITFSSSYVYDNLEVTDSESTKNISLSELEKASFSIIQVIDDTNSATGIVEYTELTRGELVNPYKDGDDFIKQAKTKESIKKGYNDIIIKGLANFDYKTKDYYSYIRRDIVKSTIIACVLSLIIAFIFYTIWQDDSKIETKGKIKFKK